MRFAPVISRRQQAVECSIVLAVLASACVAQAAPKPAYAVQAHSDRADAKYTVGDTVVFTVECLADGQPVTEATLAYSLKENDFKELAKGSVAITNGRGTIEHTCNARLSAADDHPAGREKARPGGGRLRAGETPAVDAQAG